MLPSTIPNARLALIVEDQTDTRAWLRQMLTAAFEAIAVTDVATLRAAQDWIATNAEALAKADTPPIALIDLGLPDGSGIDLIRELTRKHQTVSCIVTTIYDDDHHLFEAIAAGAQGYLLKDQHPETFVQYLHRIDRGEPPLSPSIARRMLQHFSRLKPLTIAPGEPAIDALTDREIDVLRLLGRGLRVSEAARVLGLTPHTVAGYVKNVYRKLNISSRAEAVIEALRRGLV
jgi:DNA-binding NarL/FixJ family response regulator